MNVRMSHAKDWISDNWLYLYFHFCAMQKHVSFFVLKFAFWSWVVVILSWAKLTAALFLKGKSPARKRGLNLTLSPQKSHLLKFFPIFVSLKKSLTYFIWIIVSVPSLSFLWGKRKRTAEIDILISLCQEWNLWMSTH